LALLQNADDNRYPPGTLPLLEFILGPGSITVLNNEQGFREEDMAAICSINQSTKTSSKQQEPGAAVPVGQKGIGFKSVFRVTDTPQVHSGGFHIVFDRQKHGNLGSILPTWVEPSERECSLAGGCRLQACLR
jgi:hypothetical protein